MQVSCRLLMFPENISPISTHDFLMTHLLLFDFVCLYFVCVFFHYYNYEQQSGFRCCTSQFEHEVAQPLIKKNAIQTPLTSLILEQFPNSCFFQLHSHTFNCFQTLHGILEAFQSSFKALNSTESALFKVFNNL